MTNTRMNSFVFGGTNTQVIQEVLVCKLDLCAAVAFWGEDSIPILNKALRKFPARKIKIICNLTSGATNPKFVKYCLENKNQIQIKNNSKLHSKVMYTLEKYIVGSTNISSNGLGHEGSEINGWMESSIAGNDYTVLENVKKWFAYEWKSAEKITSRMIMKAESDWQNRRINRLSINTEKETNKDSKFLIDAVLRRPQNFKDKNIYLAIFRSYLSKEAKLEHESYRQEKLIKNLASYENWEKIPENSYLIDIYFGAKEGIKIHKMNYIPNHPHRLDFKYDDGEDGNLLLGSIVDEIEGFKLFCDKKRFSKEDMKKLFDLGFGDNEGKIVDIVKVCKVFNKK